jgi:hypothetical protein
MASPKVDNRTAMAYQLLFANDENFRPLVAPVIKATFDILPHGELKFAQRQIPVNFAPVHYGDPRKSSYRFEPESAFTKVTTDVAVIGDAVAAAGPVRQLLVEIQIGALRRQLAVIGDRRWLPRNGGLHMSDPQPFDRIPLIFERAFGGWDRRPAAVEKHGFEPRNPIGRGYYSTGMMDPDLPLWLPNIEDPRHLIERVEDRPEPAGCGFTLPQWQPRARLAGTYDDAWSEQRSPLLPLDFDRRFFNAATSALIAPEYLTGDEPVRVRNMTPTGDLTFQLPGMTPPICEIHCRNRPAEYLPTCLDTVIIDVVSMQVLLIWRNYLLLNSGPLDVQIFNIHYG